jgi:N utilization substance protein B
VTTKSARRRSREFALQGLYAWLVSKAEPGAIAAQFSDAQGMTRADQSFFSQLLDGAIRQAPELDVSMQPALDRPASELSPVEHAVLLLAVYELKNFPDVPYRVVINEAVELAKSFGGTDGHKYINGVLDKLAKSLRPDDVATQK